MQKVLAIRNPKRCKVCKERFIPWNSLQAVCGPSCALALVMAKNEKKVRKE